MPPCERKPELDGLAHVFADKPEKSSAVLTALAHEKGISDTRLHVWHAAQPSQTHTAQWLERLLARSDAPLVCGMHQSSEGVVWIAAERAAAIEVDRHYGRLKATLSQGFHSPVIVVLDRHLRLDRQAVSEKALQQGVSWPVQPNEAYVIQLMATGPSGAYPVAEVWLTSSQEVPALFGNTSAPIPERLTELRRRFHVGELRINRLLSDQAHAHAREVCQAEKVAHELSAGVDPVERAQRVRIQADALGEAVARASNLSTAFDAFLRSPAHLLTLTDARFTDVGMASATDDTGARCLVVFLAAWPRIR